MTQRTESPRLRLPAPLPHRELKVPIHMYHRINVSTPGTPSMERRLTVHPADCDARIERLAQRAGYVLAVTTEHGSVQSARRPLALRRLQVLDSTGVAGLAAMLEAQ